ncbi:hypothetical protein ACNFJ7_05555 [Sphingomonas sp. HT-1]|uniref:hypothetical protein n=1 Tax=unclassified Sphingomonas TaxID=196159 RepID=UPI00038067BD|nr:MULTISPECIES: hypothetical protein [unclassified Sphingomonas]KTF67520.1 hypothetical protein ATB93_17420 [Sphingomonas sp. WG]
MTLYPAYEHHRLERLTKLHLPLDERAIRRPAARGDFGNGDVGIDPPADLWPTFHRSGGAVDDQSALVISYGIVRLVLSLASVDRLEPVTILTSYRERPRVLTKRRTKIPGGAEARQG